MSDNHKPFQGYSFGPSIQSITSFEELEETPPKETISLSDIDQSLKAFRFEGGIPTDSIQITWKFPALPWRDFVALCKGFGITPIRISWIRPRYGYRRNKPGVN